MSLLKSLSQKLEKYFNSAAAENPSAGRAREDRHTAAERLVHISNELDSAYEFIPPPPSRPFGRD